METVERFDAIVIGAGEAGSVVASMALDAGRHVAMTYKGPYGSTCLNTGCVPSKFLIHRARVAHLIRTGHRYGVAGSPPRVDLEAIVRDKHKLIDTHRGESFRAALEAERLTLIEGGAHFISAREVNVGGRILTAPRIFIATGMRSKISDIELTRVPYLTSATVMDLTTTPLHLLIVGGGYIACELGQAYHRFGARVTIIGSANRLLPREEPQISDLLKQALTDEGIEVILGHRVIRAAPVGSDVRVIARSEAGVERVITGTHVLIAAGREPNTDGLNLAAAGVEQDQQGSIKVDEFLQTTARGIYAIGDVNGLQPFTRVCQEEGKVAYVNAFEGARLAIVREALGHAIFTDPEIGSVGLTEAEAWSRGYDVAAAAVDFRQVARAELMGETTGLIKLISDRRTRRLLGCHIIGPHAAELVYDAALVIRHGGALDEIATTVGIFPTLQEGMEGTARALLRKIAPSRVAGPLVASPTRR